MPITKSAAKAMRQSMRRRKQNLLKKEAYKHAVKNVQKLLLSGNNKGARDLLPALYKTLDKAAKTNVIKENKAARLKSRITRSIFIREQALRESPLSAS